MHVGDKSEYEVRSQVPQFDCCADHGKTKTRQVSEERSSDQGSDEHSPVREWLPGQMGKDDLRRHTSEDKGHGDAKEDKPVLAKESGVRGEEPGEDTTGKHTDRCPLHENRQDREILALSCDDHVVDTCWEMCSQKGAQDNGDPKVPERRFPKNFRQTDKFRHLVRPDLRSIISRDDHNCDGDEQTLRRAVEVSKIESMRMVRLPRGKEHWQTRNQSRKSAELGRTEAHCSCLQQAGQSTIERIDAMAVYSQHIVLIRHSRCGYELKKLSQPTRCPSSSGLFTIDVVQSGIPIFEYDQIHCQ